MQKWMHLLCCSSLFYIRQKYSMPVGQSPAPSAYSDFFNARAAVPSEISSNESPNCSILWEILWLRVGDIHGSSSQTLPFTVLPLPPSPILFIYFFSPYVAVNNHEFSWGKRKLLWCLWFYTDQYYTAALLLPLLSLTGLGIKWDRGEKKIKL